MKTDQIACYSSLDKVNISRIKKRKEISKSHLAQIKKFLTFPLVIVAIQMWHHLPELPKKRPHKRVVKTGVSLFTC